MLDSLNLEEPVHPNKCPQLLLGEHQSWNCEEADLRTVHWPHRRHTRRTSFQDNPEISPRRDNRIPHPEGMVMRGKVGLEDV